MLTFAFVAEMLARAFPETWSNGGRLKVRFKTAVFPDEKVTTFGEVTEIIQTPEGPVAECKVGLRKQDGEEAIAGQAWVRLGPPER
jgi:acyl dehydratase